MDVIEQAQELLGRDQLPDDIEAQIDALFEQASDDERALFPWIYEALFVALNWTAPP